jgi:tetratricopeptide (TPR) repeat protein
LGRSFRNLGRAAERLEGAKAVRDLYGESLKARQAALPTADDPLFVKQEIAGSYGDLGRMALELGRPREALDLLTRSSAFREEWLQKAPENEEALREQAGTQSLLGHAHLSLGDTARALAQFQKALPTLNQLAEKNPANISDPVNAALCYNDIGTMHLLSGNPASAKENCDTARLRLEPVFRANSSNSAVVPDLLRKLGKVYYCLGAAFQELNDSDNAKFNLGQSVKARKQLVDRFLKDRASRQDYMLSLARAGQIGDAVELAEKIQEEAPKEPDALYMVACAYSLCAIAAENAKSEPPADVFREKALIALTQAVKEGYQATAMLKLDPDLAGVRNEAQFQKLISELEQQEQFAEGKSP